MLCVGSLSGLSMRFRFLRFRSCFMFCSFEVLVASSSVSSCSCVIWIYIIGFQVILDLVYVVLGSCQLISNY
jgi:hypothetical protein